MLVAGKIFDMSFFLNNVCVFFGLSYHRSLFGSGSVISAKAKSAKKITINRIFSYNKYMGKIVGAGARTESFDKFEPEPHKN
jgi:hypothetical protein